MLYEEAKRYAKAYIKFAKQNYYNDQNDFLCYRELPRKPRGLAPRSVTFEALLEENGPTITFRLALARSEVLLLSTPELDMLTIEGCDDIIEPPDEECNLEIQEAIEEKIQELQKLRFTEDDISEAMLIVIRNLLSKWTFPDDRADLMKV